MSLALDVDHITAVLLADGWHEVEGKSFTLDSYEYVWWPSEEARERGNFDVMHGGGQSGVCATGFSFKVANHHYSPEGETLEEWLSGPLTAILAVRHRKAP